MDYFGIIKRSFQMTLKNKFLWIFGFFIFGYSGIRFFNFNSSDFMEKSESYNGLQKVLGASTATKSIEDYAVIAGLVIALIVLIFIAWTIMSIVSQGSLIGSADKLSQNEKADFKIGFGIGWHQFWRVLGVILIYSLMVIASMAVCFLPVVLWITEEMYILAIIWGIIFFIVCLIFWILIGLISPYSLRIVVLEKTKIWEAITKSIILFRHRWGEIVVMYIILVAISLGFSIALTLAFFLVGGILLALGYGIYLASYDGAVAFGIIMGVGLVIATLVVTSAYQAFNSVALTLTYQELVKKT